jgi:hypothetical protein
MNQYTLADSDTSAWSFAQYLNSCIGLPHPDYPDRIVTGIVAVQFVTTPYRDEGYERDFYRTGGLAIVATRDAGEVGRPS